MSTELKDFSMYLSSELMRFFGDPYQSSITAVRRFEKEHLRVYVDYERERDEVNVQGLVAIGGVTLTPDDALAFIKEIEDRSILTRTYRIDFVGNNINIFPIIEFSASLGFTKGTVEKKTQKVVQLVKKVFSDLEKIEGIMSGYKKNEVGYL
jgi:hypothetical protein